MQTKITGVHFEVSDAIRSYVMDKLKRLERTFDQGVTEVEIVLKNEGRSFHCEFILHVRNSRGIVIDVAQESMYAAIDLATDKAQRQLRRHKEKVQEHRHGETTRTVAATSPGAAGETPSPENAEDDA